MGSSGEVTALGAAIKQRLMGGSIEIAQLLRTLQAVSLMRVLHWLISPQQYHAHLPTVPPSLTSPEFIVLSPGD